jgi:hypothetical protein
MAEMMLIMQALGQKTGVPVQLSAPPVPTPIASPMSIKVHFSLVLCLYDIETQTTLAIDNLIAFSLSTKTVALDYLMQSHIGN